MLEIVLNTDQSFLIISLSVFAAVIICFLGLRNLSFLLPTDGGRDFAVQGEISKGKPTGTGLIFISVFVVFALLALPFSPVNAVLLLLVEITMITGFLDDKSKKPWSEYKKGLFDLLVAGLGATIFALMMDRTILFPLFGLSVELPIWLYIVLGTILIWGSINVTNCADGVDGLSASLSSISVIFVLALSIMLGTQNVFGLASLFFLAVILPYLWYNAPPSKLLMGDAGSRAIGLLLALFLMQAKIPFAFFVVCFIFIVDGGLGILKISLKRFLRISILKNTLTPIHDHLRKNRGWSNPQVTARMSLIHLLICTLYITAIFLIR